MNVFFQKQGQRGKIGGNAAATGSATKTVEKNCRLWCLLPELLRQFTSDRHWTKPRNDPEHRDSLFQQHAPNTKLPLVYSSGPMTLLVLDALGHT